MNIIAKIVATLKYIERVNWCVSKGRVCPTHSALLEWPAPLEVRSSEPMHERLEEADYADDETDYAEDEKPAQIGTCARWLVWASGHPP